MKGFKLKDLHRKVKFDLPFVGILLAVLVVSFFVLELLFGFLFGTLGGPYDLDELSEKDYYLEGGRELEDDLELIIRPTPSKLNGAPIESAANRGQVLAVVVENYTPIRGQQAGLEQADLVYEVLAEGGITRLLALYNGQAAGKIGPVRSARPYFISWASEYAASFAHVGGSQAALNNLKTNNRLFNIDEFSDFQTIFRDNQYTAPHNAYTSTGKILQRLNKDRYYKPLDTPRFEFKEPDATPGDVNVIEIDFSFTPYKVKYQYDAVSGRYERFNGGVKHHNIEPTNVLVQFVETEVLDDIGRLYIQTHGIGEGLVFRDGKVIDATWQKDCSVNSSAQPLDECFTKFYDADGFEIPLNPGPIWIEVVPVDRKVTYS